MTKSLIFKQNIQKEFVIAGQLGTYFLIFNVNDSLLADFTEAERIKIRKAMTLMIDRNYVVVEYGQAGQMPANSYVPSGLTEPDGSSLLTIMVQKDGSELL